MFQARIIRQEVAITVVEGDTLEAGKEKLRVWLENMTISRAYIGFFIVLVAPHRL
jgi:hypothetical protein